MDTFEISSDQLEGYLFLLIRGYFSQEAGDALINITEEKHSAGAGKFVLDFSECAVMNSTGLSALLDLYEMVQDWKAELHFIGLNDTQFATLQSMGLVTRKAYIATEEKLSQIKGVPGSAKFRLRI